MRRIKAAYAAVDIIAERLVYLQLGCDRGKPFVCQWHEQPLSDTISNKVRCQELMTVMEHRALYYQQLTQTQTTNPSDIYSCVEETFGHSLIDGAERLQIDYQHSPAMTEVVSVHASQVKKRQQQFAALSGRIRIVEPAFQAVVRATNYLLSETQRVAGQVHTAWLVIELNQPLSTCISCQFGVVTELNFVAESDLPQVIDKHPATLFFGDSHGFSDAVNCKLNRAFKLSLPTSIHDRLSSLPTARALILFGNALRGFSQWHH